MTTHANPDGRTQCVRPGVVAVLDTVRSLLASVDVRSPEDGGAVDDHGRIDIISTLQATQAACAALRARAEVAFADSQISEHLALVDEGAWRRERVGWGISDQLALARRESGWVAARDLRTARLMVEDCPHLFAALAAGAISERTATAVAGEWSHLGHEDRAAADDALAGDDTEDGGTSYGSRSTRESMMAARRQAQTLDPEGAVARAKRAEAQRRVTIRPAPDTMAHVTALLPMVDGVAVWGALDNAASTALAAGDPRGRGQIMADTLVERVTGRSKADGFDVEITLFMPADTMRPGSSEPADVDVAGHRSPIPAAMARDLIGETHDTTRVRTNPFTARRRSAGSNTANHTTADTSDTTHTTDVTDTAETSGTARDAKKADVFLRRVFTDPVDDTVIAVDTRRRRFDGALRRLIRVRDQHCRTPHCDSPIRDLDHTVPYASGGATSHDNGVGYCAHFNQVKELPGWNVEVQPDFRPDLIPFEPAPPDSPGRDDQHQRRQRRRRRRHHIVITTPTGHRYSSRAPTTFGTAASPPDRSVEPITLHPEEPRRAG